ncbi:MAG: DUF815 domain-containing protein, partial [Candidatus Gastranaerophilales bacterium]|nr:DUF815 domain-containing protein [Candidatus Gastranaerophilales bacterium]
MNKKQIEQIYFQTHFLIHFKNIKNDSVIKNFISFLKEVVLGNNLDSILEKYSEFMFSIKSDTEKNFSIYLKNCVLNEKIDKNFKQEIEREFVILSSLSKIDILDIKKILKNDFPELGYVIDTMPDYKTSIVKFALDEFKTTNENKNFDNNRTFVFNNKQEIEPVSINEKMTFASLKGYKKQKEVLYNNTSSLLKGLKVNNILLYGDAGCGKSTSVRALLNEFPEIKMVQIFKDNLINLDKLYLKLAELPYKFIIFADDISFSDTDDTLSTTKAILEGALVQCPENAVIYATSNRRHLIKESFKSREGDEIHLNDTINEISSLSERFGINLLFQKPNNEEFKEIALAIAHELNVELNDEIIIQE